MTLIVLAAGMGSRFGGLKQIEPINTNGNFIIDYSVYDARRAGFDKVVFIIKKENYEVFKNTIGKRIEDKMEVHYVFQDNNDVPDGVVIPKDRVKPLGTGHALYSAREFLNEPCAIISADDFYGREAFELIANHLKTANECAIIGYKIKNTMSEFDSVKRGVYFTENGYVKNFVESKIKRHNGKLVATTLSESDEDGKIYSINEDQLVAMSFYGLIGNLKEFVEKDCEEFFSNRNDLDVCEYFLPNILTRMIEKGIIKLKSIPTDSKWMGITYREDLDKVKETIDEMTKTGIYPESLW